MHSLSESGNTFSKTVAIMSLIGLMAAYGVYLTQRTLNNIYAEDIVNGVWAKAKEEKKRIDPIDEEEENEEEIYTRPTERKGYSFTIAEGTTPTLVKVDTEKKAITPGVCRALKKKFKESMWWDAFTKVVIVDRMGDEKTDVLIYDCPHEKIPTLRFYVKFADNKETKVETTEETDTKTTDLPPPPVVVPQPVSTPKTTSTRRNYSTPSYSRSNCPMGTSSTGAGGYATMGCRCNHSGESWNGRSCEMKACPRGSSRNSANKGNRTNISGCICNNTTPIWSADEGVCVKCANNMVLDKATGKCVKATKEQDCRWGICQTCSENGIRHNIIGEHPCEVAGLPGMCNNNGTCYPTAGRKCSSTRGCLEGEFCNYGGNYNTTKRQIGAFGQTPNVCQKVTPQEFTYKKITYYYNTEADLKAWCRAANNKANCLWGYLAKPGAISWCSSLGKRLLKKAEMAEVWNELKKELPKTYKGYAYWVEEGVWIEDNLGRRSFGNGHPDGYGGRGGVVCK